MIESPLKAFVSLFNLRFVATVAIVVALVAPLGVAMTGRFGLGWVISGAVIRTVLFGYAASRTGRSQVAWGLAGGLMLQHHLGAGRIHWRQACVAFPGDLVELCGPVDRGRSRRWCSCGLYLR